MRSWMLLAMQLSSAFALVACQGEKVPDQEAGLSPVANAANEEHAEGERGGDVQQGQDAHADAHRRFSAFLDASRASSPSPVPDSLIACDPEWAASRNLVLAEYKILGIAGTRDTLLAAAEVVTVAEESQDPHRADAYVLRQRVGVDTLHWVMVRRSPAGPFGICNYSTEGVDFLGASPGAAATSRVPEGASWNTILALADSITRRQSR
jgi:hypothetical protein